MTTQQPTMTAAEYRALLKRLDLSQVRAGRLVGISDRHAQRLAAGDAEIPKAVAIVLKAMVRFDLTPDDIEKMIRQKR